MLLRLETRSNGGISVWTIAIPMRDGTRLAGRLWLPKMGAGAKVSTIFEYLPYRVHDGTRGQDDITYSHFANAGYAGLRVDVRGTGDSDGLFAGEYTLHERQDALEVLEWVAAQDWSNGAVGMIGMSYGGINALQIAAMQPPQLKTIITMMSADDRFVGDCHYIGGALSLEALAWGSAQLLCATQPPDPAIVGDKWREMWQQRLNGARPALLDWLAHPTKNAFWKDGSVSENYAAITIPVLAVGGWMDGYTATVFRLLDNLGENCVGLIGPWTHDWPNQAAIAPMPEFLDECVAWWDYGLCDFPHKPRRAKLTAWIQAGTDPLQGDWIRLENRPGVATSNVQLPLHGIDDEGPVPVRSPQTFGHTGGKFCPMGHSPMLPQDQRAEEGAGRVFQTDPLEAKFDVLGAPQVELLLSSDCASGHIVACLSDVAPDGAVKLVSFGVLNLAHRAAFVLGEEIIPGEEMLVRLELKPIGYRFGLGHRVRLTFSTSYWPMTWPTAQIVTLTLNRGGLTMPVLGDAPFVKLQLQPAGLAPIGQTRIDRTFDSEPVEMSQIDRKITQTRSESYSIDPWHPSTATAATEVTWRSIGRGHDVTVTNRIRMWDSSGLRRLEIKMTACDGDTSLATRRWTSEYPW